MSTIDEEPTPEEVTGQRRYYNDVPKVLENRFDIVTSIEKLLISDGLIGEDTDINNLFAHVRRVEAYSSDPRLQAEQYMLLPIREMGATIELTKPLKDIEKWYDEAARFILAFTKPAHDRSCIDEHDKSGFDACTKSEQCPIRVLERTLMGDTYDVDFNNVFYMFDPKKTYEVTLLKAQLALNKELVSPRVYERHISAYTTYYGHTFDESATRIEPEDQP